MKKDNDSKIKCWYFVMSSFSRSYGVDKVRSEEKFHEIALFWCDENEIEKYTILEEYDIYFRNLYENWE